MTDVPTTTDHTDIEALTTHLKATLSTPSSPETLEEQTQILHQVFTTIMADKVAARLPNCDRYPDTVMDWLALSLKIQKQCTATVKAKAAIDYMNALTPTPPVKIEKRTEGS